MSEPLVRSRLRVTPRYLRPRPSSVLGLSATAWAAVIALVVVAILEAITRFGVVDSFTLLPISTMLLDSADLLTDTAFLIGTLLPTISLILVSFGVSVVLGVALAYLLWRSRWWRQAIEPYLNIYYAVPHFALYPVLVVLFGLGAIPIVLLAVALSLVAVTTNTLDGFAAVPRAVTKLAESLRLTGIRCFVKVLLPAAMPNITVGVRLGLVYSTISVLATQFILASEGLGHYIAFAYRNFDVHGMYAGIVIVWTVALVLNVVVSQLLRRFDWRAR